MRINRHIASLVLIAGLAESGTAAGSCWAMEFRAQNDEPRVPSELSTDAAREAHEKRWDELLGIWLSVYTDVLDGRPAAGRSPRENAFAALNLVTLGIMVPAGVGMPLATTFIGGGVGTLVGIAGAIPSLGASLPLLIGAGSAIGLGWGMVGTIGVTGSAMLLYAIGTIYIDEHYPAQVESAMAPHRARGNGFEGWNGSASAVGFLEPGLVRGAAASVTKLAGPEESLAVQIVESLVTDRIVTIAKQWDRAPGLTGADAKVLREFAFLRPYIQRLAYIKEHRRAGPRAPIAEPQSKFFTETVAFLRADKDAVQQAWLNSFGLSSLRLSVRNGKLTLPTPASFRAVGAPNTWTVDAPSIHVKFPPHHTGGLADPYIRFQFQPGDFDINWGTAQLMKSGSDAGRIRVAYTISKHAQLCTASLKYKWEPQTGNKEEAVPGVGSFRPRLSDQLNGYFFFDVAGHGLAFQRAQFPNIGIDLRLPQLPEPLRGFVDGASKELDKQIQGLLKGLPFASVFADYKTRPSQSLLAELRANPGTYDMIRIDDVRSLDVKEGQLQARVRGARWSGPKVDDLSAVRAAVAKRNGLRPQPSLPTGPSRRN